MSLAAENRSTSRLVPVGSGTNERAGLRKGRRGEVRGGGGGGYGERKGARGEEERRIDEAGKRADNRLFGLTAPGLKGHPTHSTAIRSHPLPTRPLAIPPSHLPTFPPHTRSHPPPHFPLTLLSVYKPCRGNKNARRKIGFECAFSNRAWHDCWWTDWPMGRK